ncbi:MAG: polysaccharide biosynthesis protein [Candidatus Staskawiczbacteria bacterium]|jgi:FlaA1/EpsC-like NDP-sugar epimerase
MEKELKNKKVLITGGAGSVGNALIKELLKYDINVIRVFDLSENEIAKVRCAFPNEEKLRYLIGDIKDINRLKMAMDDIDIVIHLAAMKHVYACEYNPFEAIKTNIEGLQNVIDCARNENVEKVIFTSTDKAAHPLSVMGITKLLGEKLVSLAEYYKGDKRTLFASVRFGNVFGSNGSVVPLFKEQIKKGEVLITNSNMTRFVITMDEAVKLIFKAIKLVRGGEVFIWKMKAFKVADLAKVMIEKYGIRHVGGGSKVQIIPIGIREGEKMNEEIMSEEEPSRAVEMGNLYVIFPIVDHARVRSKYQNTNKIENAIIASDKAIPLSEKEIGELLETETDL